MYIEKALLPESTHLDIKSMPSPRLFKSHLSYDAIPKSTDEAKTTCKYIYVARNPKDAAVSSYKFMGSFGTNGMNAPWEFYAKLFIEGKSKYMKCFQIAFMSITEENHGHSRPFTASSPLSSLLLPESNIAG